MTTEVFKDSTSHSPFFELVDSTTGLPKPGILYTDVTASYARTRGARTAITPATLASASASWSSGGFILVDDTNQPGIYRFDVPNAAFATGVEEVVVTIKATGCRTVSRGFTLIDINKQDPVRAGMTALPNAAAEAAGGLYTRGTGAGQINQPANGMIDTNPVRLGGVAQSLTDLKDFADTGYDPVTHKVADVALLNGAATVVLTDASLTTAKLGAFALAKTTNITGFNDITAAAVEAAILNEGDATALLAAIAAKVEEFLINDGDATATIAAIATAVNAAVVAGTVGSNVTAILVDTNELQTDWVNGGRLDAILDARASQTSVDAISAAAISDAVWDEILSGHAIAGSTGAGLSSAGAAGDPLSSAVPGAYAAGTAGFALGEVAGFTSQEVSAPLVGSIGSVGEVVDSQQIFAYHYGPIEAGPFAVFEEDGVTPLDMSAYATELMFVVYEVVTSSAGVKSERAIGRLTHPNVILGGAGNNQVTLANTTPLTVEIGRFRWAVRRTTTNNKPVRMQGWIVIDPCANTA